MDISVIQPVAVIGDRSELIGDRGGGGAPTSADLQATLVAVAQTCIADRGGCGYWRSLTTGPSATPVVLIMALNSDFGCPYI